MSPSKSSTGDDAFVIEQFMSITRAIPNVFVNILIISAIFCCFIYKQTPSSAALWAVAPLVAICGVRAIYWRNLGRRANELSIERMRRLLRVVVCLCMALCASFAAIVVLTMSTPEIFVQSSIAILIIASATTMSLHLFTLPLAAMSVIWSASLATIVVFLRSNNLILVGCSLSILVIAVAMTRLLREHYDNFRKLVKSRAEIDLMREDAVTLAMTDALTGLPNRRMFDLRMKDCARANRGFAVAVIDLDGFKPVNDVYGHSIGDLFLIEAARRMQGAGEVNLIARMGGDEFAMLIENVANVEDAAAVARAAVRLISMPYTCGRITTSLGASCGVAMWRRPGDEERIVERADIALYQAKDRDRGAVVIFSDALELDLQRRAMIECGLREAIANDELRVHFQPIVRISTGAVTSFEALARWEHSELGDIPPNIFIALAEHAGLIEVVTDRLLRKAARAAIRWPAHISLSFNLSATQLVRPSAAASILGALAECGLPPNRFEAEVTETAIMSDVTAAAATISALKLAGVRVSLDDFGTGYSSFRELCELPLDRVKIDKSLVDKIGHDQRAAGVVSAIIKMCDSLKLKCVAEGVESAEQMRVLTSLGCEKAQGYFISRPMSEEITQKTLDDLTPIRLTA